GRSGAKSGEGGDRLRIGGRDAFLPLPRHGGEGGWDQPRDQIQIAVPDVSQVPEEVSEGGLQGCAHAPRAYPRRGREARPRAAPWGGARRTAARSPGGRP